MGQFKDSIYNGFGVLNLAEPTKPSEEMTDDIYCRGDQIIRKFRDEGDPYLVTKNWSETFI